MFLRLDLFFMWKRSGFKRFLGFQKQHFPNLWDSLDKASIFKLTLDFRPLHYQLQEKTPMEKRYLLIFLFGLLGISAFSQTKPIVEFTAGRQTANVGDTVCIPITVQNFQAVLGIGFGMRWNADALELVEVKTDFALPVNPISNFGLTEGDLKWSWIASNFPNGLSLEANDTLFQVCFVPQAFGAGGFYSVSFDDSFVVPEVILDEQIFPDDQIANYNFTSGGIFINGSNDLTVIPAFDFSLGCNTYNAILEVDVSGGLPPYNYSWVGPQSIFSSARRLSNLTREGLYNLTVTDANGEVAVAELLVDFMENEEGLPFPMVNASTQNPDCGESNGSISLSLNASPGTYQLEWSTGDTTLNVENLTAGVYDVTITSNENTCSDSFVFELVPIGVPEVDTLLSNLTCAGDDVEIGILGLNDNFSYTWNTGEQTNVITVNEPAEYQLTATDGSCVLNYNLIVGTELDAPNENNFFVTLNNLSCLERTAEIGVRYIGLRSLTYLWSTGDTVPNITVNQIGLYTLEVFSENGCSTTFEFPVDEEVANLPITKDSTFQGCTKGSTLLELLTSNPAAYDYLWSTGSDSVSTEVQVSGIYFVTVTDRITACTQVFEFDLDRVDPSQAPISTNLECITTNNCYEGALLDINVDGFVSPISYSLNTGESKTGTDEIQFELFDRQPRELYLEDAVGCRDTVSNLIQNCLADTLFVEMRVRQYVVCEEQPETEEIQSVLYNEVLGNLSVPPYTFTWGNGFVDTSYYRSRQLLDSLPNLFISVVDQQSNRLDRQLSETPASYGCGDDSAPVIEAEDIIVTPGQSFVYPIHISNQEGLQGALYTIDWDPCLLTVDSVVFYTNENDRMVSVRPITNGTDESFFNYVGGSPSNEKRLIEEIYFRADSNLQGVSPFIFSINEIATNGDGSNQLVRAKHGSITISDGRDLVNPGDANLNGAANHQDVLNIALAFENAGPDRRNRQVDQQEYSLPWFASTPKSEVDFRNMDCNGDGVVNAADLEAIEQNFSYTLQPGRVIGAEGEIPLYLDADTLLVGLTQTFPVILGEDLLPAESVYGLAFSLQYDPNVIASESIELDLQGSWLFEQGETPLTLLRVDEENQLIHIAISRTDATNKNGFGVLANLRFQTIDLASGNTTFQVMDATMISADETSLLTLNRTTNSIISLSTSTNNAQFLSRQIQLYPNPVGAQLYLATQDIDIQSYSILDANGRHLRQAVFEKNLIDVENLGTGLYLLRLVTKQGVVTKRFVK